MRITGRLATNIEQMTKYEARDALAEMQRVFGDTKGRIVFTKDAQGNLTGASRSRGLWSGIKAVFSRSYRDRLQTTEEDFGRLMAKAAGQDAEPKVLVRMLRRNRTDGERSQLESDPAVQVARQHGMAPPKTYVEGQLTPGLLGAFVPPTDKTQQERIEHATDRLTGMMLRESCNLPDFMIALSDLHCAGHYFFNPDDAQTFDERAKSLTRGFLTKAIKALPDEQLKSLFKFINHEEFTRFAYGEEAKWAVTTLACFFGACDKQEENLETMSAIFRAFKDNAHQDAYNTSSVFCTVGKVGHLAMMAATISDIAEEVAKERSLDAHNDYLHEYNRKQDAVNRLIDQGIDADNEAELDDLQNEVAAFNQEKVRARTTCLDQLIVRGALYGGDFRKASEDLKQNPQLIQQVQGWENFFEHGIDASLVELVKNCPMECDDKLFGPITL